MDSETRNLRAVGTLYMVFGVLYALLAGYCLQSDVAGTDEALTTGIFVFIGVYGVFLFVAGHQLRQYRAWAWWTCAILSGLGLLNFPIGTLIHGLLLSALIKGKYMIDAGMENFESVEQYEDYEPLPEGAIKGVYPYQSQAKETIAAGVDDQNPYANR